MQTRSYFDGRPDARFFMMDVDGIVVAIRHNLSTYGVTDGEVWIAFRVHDRLIERRFETVDRARRAAARFVRDSLGRRSDAPPTIGAWIAIRRAEYAVACPNCHVEPRLPCVDEDAEPMIEREGTALMVGAPYKPALHEVDVTLSPLVHAGRCTALHHALHGAPKQSPSPAYRPERIFIK